MRRTALLSTLLVLAMATAAAPTAPPAAPAQSGTAASTDERTGHRTPTAPEGGPVDDGWLPGPDGGSFAQFTGEPVPGGGPVWPGVRRDARQTTLADGKPVHVQILHMDPGADVQVRPSLAGGTVRGLATVAEQSGNPLHGAVAAVNGGFWLREPAGEPNGFFAVDERLVSDAETQGAGPRGTVGWTRDGRLLVDRIDSQEVLTLADGTRLVVDGINRGHREHHEMFPDGVDSLLAHTADYGGPVALRQPERPAPPPTSPDAPPAIPDQPGAQDPGAGPVDLAAVRITAPRWPVSGAVAGTVVGITRDEEASFTPGVGEVVLTATGAMATALDGVEVGDAVAIETTLTAKDPARAEPWAQVTRALAAGPMIVKDGRMTEPADWVDEGFEPHVHSDVRAPRTAIGVTAEGRTLMVVADGRRPGVTHGFTIAELAQYMISLGAVEALSLDGGGSSQMVVDGILRNVPCCDSSTRRVADSLQLVHAYPFSATRRLQGAGRVQTAAEIARDAHAGGAANAVLATAGSFPDALAGGPLAVELGAPVLLTGATAVPAESAAVLGDLGVRTVWLLGGEAVIGPEVAAQLTAAGYEVRRVAGGSRFDTAAEIATTMRSLDAGSTPRRAFLVPAGTFHDALLAAGPGGRLGMPILLTDGGRLHPASREALDGVEEVVVIDADEQITAAVVAEVQDTGAEVTRIGGGGRYATAAAVDQWLAEQVPMSDAVVVARGDDFPDALAGGPLAAAQHAHFMLLPGQIIEADPAAGRWFEETSAAGGMDRVTVLGGLAAVSSYEQWQLDALAVASADRQDPPALAPPAPDVPPLPPVPPPPHHP